jgi:preprotein translocase subunit Sec63
MQKYNYVENQNFINLKTNKIGDFLKNLSQNSLNILKESAKCIVRIT